MRTIQFSSDLIKGLSYLHLADLVQSPFDRLHLLDEARNLGLTGQSHRRVDALKQAADVFGWNDDYSPISVEGLRYCVAAAELGCAKSNRILGEVALKEQFEELDHRSVVQLFSRALLLGDAAAQARLGEIHEGQAYFERNDFLAFKAFEAATAAEYEYAARSDPLDQPVRWNRLGDLAFDDEGFGLSSPWKVWTLANGFWLKAVGSNNPFSAKVRLRDLPSFDALDGAGASALVKIARSLFFGLGLRRDVTMARLICRRLYKKVALARELLWEDWLYNRNVSISRLAHVREILSRADLHRDPAHLWQCFRIKRFHTKTDLTLALQEVLKVGCPEGPRVALLVDTVLFDVPDLPNDIVEQCTNLARRANATHTNRALYSDDLRIQVKTFRDFLVAALRTSSSEPEAWSRLLWPSPDDVVGLVAEIQAVPTDEVAKLHFIELLETLSRLRGDPEQGILARISKEVQIRSRTFQEMFAAIPTISGVRSAHALASSGAFEAVLAATSAIGPDLNVRDESGFPMPIRAPDNRTWRERTRTRVGWDRISAIEVSPNGLLVADAVPAAKGFMPLIFKEDLEVAAILAMVEVHENGPDTPAPSLSLEGLSSSDRIQWKVLRKVFSNPSWIAATDFGRSMYYADTLLFISRSGRGVFSTTNPLDSPYNLPGRFTTPWPWVAAENGGGVHASAVGRNAFVVGGRVPGSYQRAIFDPRRGTLAVRFPQELVHFDGSEKVFDREGNELHRDGGRHLLRYQSVRAAAVKTREIDGVFQSFPTFQRVAHLLAIYATLREAFEGHREKFIGTRLWRALHRQRTGYIREYENTGRAFEYVIDH